MKYFLIIFLLLMASCSELKPGAIDIYQTPKNFIIKRALYASIFYLNTYAIYIRDDGKNIYKTSFAHELLHYFQKYVGKIDHPFHIPSDFWLDLVGFNSSEIGSLNEFLKESDL